MVPLSLMTFNVILSLDYTDITEDYATGTDYTFETGETTETAETTNWFTTTFEPGQLNRYEIFRKL